MSPRSASAVALSFFLLTATGCGAAPSRGAAAPMMPSGNAESVSDNAPGAGAIDRKVVRSASVDLEVNNDKAVEKSLAALREIPKSFSGYVANESSHGLTLRVASAHVDEALARVARCGKVVRKDIRAEDVTAQSQDLGIRLDNAKKLREQYQATLEKTQDVTQILAVEKELARVTELIEQLEGQKRLLDSQVGLATIDVSVETEVTPGPVGWVFYGAYRGVKWLFVWD